MRQSLSLFALISLVFSSVGASAVPGRITEKQALALAERQSWTFCHPRDLSIRGCDLHALFTHGKWSVMATPWLRGINGTYYCCAPDQGQIFEFSADGVFL